MPTLEPLPIDAYLALLREHLRAHRAAVVVAAPGAGKTTRVPPALAAEGRVLVLQPRRAAARSLARRVAEERGWTLGREVGWHVRFEPRFDRETRVLFATEGILTARLQQDPLLEDVRTVVLDEFHERSVHADLGLALVKQAWLARGDLRVVVMSATLDADPVIRYLHDCPLLEVPGERHALETTYAADQALPAVLDQVMRRQNGNVLCFLPGAREIEEAMPAVARLAAGRGADVLPLHGTLPAAAQDIVLTPADRRRVVLATNLAETSVTVPGVRAVIDTGWQKVARYDAARGIDTLRTERVTADAADQRAGRAARLGAGIAVRLWSEHDRLRRFRDPEITRVDLAPVLLAILAWGGDVESFDWFEAPPEDRRQEALGLLARLGAIDDGITALGRRLARLPLSPRLARIVMDTAGHPEACMVAALLSEGRLPAPDSRTTASDLSSLLPGARALPHLRRAAAAIARAASDIAGADGASARAALPALDEERLCRAVLAGFPDRVAQRRAAHGDALLLAAGSGARQAFASGVREAAYLVALDVRASEGREAVVALASAVERDWLVPTHTTRRVWVDDSGRLRAARAQRYDALTVNERSDALQPGDRALLVAAWREAPRREADAQWLARLAFCGVDADVDALLQTAARDATTLAEIDLGASLPWQIRQRVSTDAPDRLPLPSGRTAALFYDTAGGVRAAVKLQELFGLAETPRIGSRREPVLLELLAPNGHAVQTTRDLRSFWSTTYAEVRKQLRGRYPKHPWPDDPWTATPTHRTKRPKP